MRRVFSLCMATGVLAGCAAPAYVPPTGDNTAKLEVRANLNPRVTVSLFTYENGLTCSNRQLLNGGTPAAGGSASSVRLQNLDSRLKAETVQTIDAFFSQSNFYCRIAVSFYAQKGRIYTARPGYGDGKCFVLIYDTTASVGGVLERTQTKRVNGEPLMDAGNWCKPMAESEIRDKQKSTSSSTGILDEATGGQRRDGGNRSRDATLDDLESLLPGNK